MSRHLTFVSLKGVGRHVHDFFSWWCQELEATFADISDRLGLHWRRAVRLDLSGHSIDVTFSRGARIERTESWPVAALEDSTAQDWPVLPRRVSLGIPKEWALRVRLEFPIAAKGHCRSAIELKLPQISPIPVTEIYWTFATVAEDDAHLSVDVIIVRRSAVDTVLNRLVERGVDTSWLNVQPGGAHCAPFNTPSRALLSQVTWRRLNWGLGAMLAAALLTVAWAWHYRISNEILALERAYESVKASASKDLDRRQQIARDQTLLRQLSAREPPSPGSVFLSVLHDTLPAPIWLQDMDCVGREVHITLYVPPRAEVAKLLLESSAIQSVTENTRISLGVGITEERVELSVVMTARPQT
jgi:hypothetical protein